MTAKVAEFYARQGRDPTPFERAAMERETAADTRGRKTGVDHATLFQRWLAEAATLGVTPAGLEAMVRDAARALADTSAPVVSVASVVNELSDHSSSWHRMDVVRTICDQAPAKAGVDGARWVHVLDRAVDTVLDSCVDLDPDNQGTVRGSDGRSVWIEPTANHFTSSIVLAQEHAVLAFASDSALESAVPSTTIERGTLDVVQGEAAAAVAGHGPLTVIIGPAGTGKTTMLTAAVNDLTAHRRPVFGVAPTAKAAAVLARETGMAADTVAKLLHEWSRPDRDPEPRWRLPSGTTLIVDEAGVVSTPDLARLTELARREHWRLVLVGDPRQLQAVGRGGLLAEVARIVTPIELETIHRFTQPWEAAASLQLRHGNPDVLDVYQRHGRIRAGTLAEHLDTIADHWQQHHRAGVSLAITATTNDHARLINTHLQAARVAAEDIDPTHSTVVRDDAVVYVGDVVATRRNLRHLITDSGEMVRNRDRWTVTRISNDGALTLAKLGQPGTVSVLQDTVRDTIELGYAVTEYGNQGDTHTAAIALVSPVTSARGLYVAMTRGRQHNVALVVTDTHNPADARARLEHVLAVDRVDIPATVQRRQLAAAAGTSAPLPVSSAAPHEPAPVAPPVPPSQAEPEPVPSAPAATPRLARTVVPAWFAEACSAVIDELGEARDEERASVNAGHQRRAEIAAAGQRLQHAHAACEPFDTALAAARRALEAAVRDRDTAAERAARARFLARRDARAELAIAEHAVASARAKLAEAELAAEPARTERRAAAAARSRLERADRDQGLIDAYNSDPQRARDLERKLAAFERWYDWATGAPTSDRAIGQLDRELERGLQHDWMRDDPAAKLADTLRHWAAQNELVLPEPSSVPRAQDRYLSIEL